MNLIGLMPVRNEAWILGLSARVALLYCDSLVILNHASTDRSAEIIAKISEENPGRVSVIKEPDPSWNEMEHRQKMLTCARVMGATHIMMCDADEIISGDVLPEIRKHILATLSERLLHLPIYNFRGTPDRYHATGIWGNRVASAAFLDLPCCHWKGDRFHHREPFGLSWTPYQPVAQGNGGIMHLWGVSERRLIARHALYKVTERLRWPSKPVAEIEQLYNYAIREAASQGFGAWTFKQAPESWWKPYERLMRHLHVDEVPWQEAEVRSLVAAHGRARFAGLDLFGVA